uniref:Large ribosomal subunit protein uL4c n=1 Tax=Hildenbrandia rivularis TaxID=135206 RepID=A0A1C9CFT3_9FLOR|nr:ribosomal protein L4 [Hildenbrandia rivularis]AOM67243.1 ribosomal protein L4 [Hildenbrandia rivularis]
MTVIKQTKYFIYNSQGITNKEVNINFTIHSNNSIHIIHRAYTTQITQHRQGTHATKTKSAVQGGGKKPWKQKGTGKARAGSNRSPLWRGGGVVFGPKYRQYNKKINRKEKALAIQSCLENRNSNIIIMNNDFIRDFSQPKTQLILKTLKNWGVNNQNKILIVIKTKNQNLYLSTRNIPNINITLAQHLNIRSILLAQTILISVDSIPIIERCI